MILFGLLLFIILLIIFTGGGEGGGGGGGSLPAFDVLILVTSQSGTCTDPFDEDSTETVDAHYCVFISADSQSYCYLENSSCSFNVVYDYLISYDFDCTNFSGPPGRQCGKNESQTLGNSISALAYIHNKYPELASYENIEEPDFALSGLRLQR